ncbi:MAG: glutathione synthase [Rhodospirillales bacterium]|jgi:glutathione synthase|nr:glutathione synthase [Rhodospirillales bacterium]MBT4039313.1 glutathione synthase [Rhodospirillales bacterium]MBT4628265.1 glutathione synthase [Rhodospirillales bacterium]MBT5352014.1 glutathione synthase [Rhodospirillales bacterium]MBT5519756.1 glutathione synthase [Rhodospirillales bacterium]
MGLKVAIQMDHISTVDINGDSTFVLALEAQRRGHTLYHYLPTSLSLDQGNVLCQAEVMTVEREHGAHYTLGEQHELNLRDVDVVLMRQDPPFDMSYITATHILDHIHPETLVVNDPTHVRNAPEKLFVMEFPDLMPPTLITRDAARVASFRDKHKDIIVKPLFGNGGAGVFHLQPGDENLNSLLEMFFEASREPVMVQEYLPAVREGDKRIILIDGEPVGAINRIPAEGEARSNMHVGGRAVASTLTEREHEICQRIGPALKERGLIFVGIDVIGDYMTEINVTSPTGLQEIGRYDGVSLENAIWDAIEGKLA